VIVERIAQRRGHFMPPALLDSQFDALQVPSPEEQAWVIDIAKSPDEIIATLMARASA
jgi:gluconokinase